MSWPLANLGTDSERFTICRRDAGVVSPAAQHGPSSGHPGRRACPAVGCCRSAGQSARRDGCHAIGRLKDGVGAIRGAREDLTGDRQSACRPSPDTDARLGIELTPLADTILRPGSSEAAAALGAVGTGPARQLRKRREPAARSRIHAGTQHRDSRRTRRLACTLDAADADRKSVAVDGRRSHSDSSSPSGAHRIIVALAGTRTFREPQTSASIGACGPFFCPSQRSRESRSAWRSAVAATRNRCPEWIVWRSGPLDTGHAARKISRRPGGRGSGTGIRSRPERRAPGA